MNDDPSIQNQSTSAPAEVASSPAVPTQPVQPIGQFAGQNITKPKKSKLLLIVAAVIIAGVLGALGYILISNSKDNLTEIVTDNLLETGISLKYPKSWVLTTSSGTSPTINVTSITSPDGAVGVTFNMAQSIVGSGEADPNLNETLVLSELADITNYSGALLTSRVFKMTNNLYRYNIGTEENSEGTRLPVVGDITSEYTSVYGPGWLPVSDLTGSQGDFIRAFITLNNLKDREIVSLDAVSAEMQNSNYLTAKRIIQSMYVK
jgi:hypothetical protein